MRTSARLDHLVDRAAVGAGEVGGLRGAKNVSSLLREAVVPAAEVGEPLAVVRRVEREVPPVGLRGREGAVRAADRAPASRAVRAQAFRQDADARWRDAGHHARRVHLPRDDDARADPRAWQGAQRTDHRRRRLRHRRRGVKHKALKSVVQVEIDDR